MYKQQRGRTWYNGRLNPDQESRLLRHKDFLINDLETDQLLEIEVTKDLFNIYDRNAISYAPTKVKKNTKLLEILEGKSPEGFQDFLQALLVTGHAEAHRKLTLTEESDVATGEVAVQTEDATEDEAELGATGGSGPPSPESVFSTASLAEEQKDQQRKLTYIEDCVEKLADSVEALALKVDESNKRVLGTEQSNSTKLDELQKAMHEKESLLLSASEKLKDLHCKLEELEREKAQALEKANKTIDHMSKEIEELNKQKKLLEAEVKRLTAENEELRDDVQQINKDKELVQKELTKQGQKLKAISDKNDMLEEKLAQKEQILQLVVSKVEKIEMRVESGYAKPKRGHSSFSKRGRKISFNSSNDEQMASATADAQSQKKPGRRHIPEPTRQCVARPNSKRQ